MIALLDGDILAFRTAAVAEKEKWDEKTLYEELSRQVINLLSDVGAKRYGIYLSGSHNFRKKLCYYYKANRQGKPIPPLLKTANQYLIDQWGATKFTGLEADDLISIISTAIRKGNRGFKHVIISDDKDMLTLPTLHYNMRTKAFTTISPLEAQTRFCIQLLQGDTADNVKGLTAKTEHSIAKYGLNKRKGIGEKTAANIVDQIRPKDRIGEILKLYVDLHGNKGYSIFAETYALLRLVRNAPPGFNPKSTIRVFRKASNKFAYVSRPNHKQLNGKVEE